jgi:hypothetical protein
MGDWVPFVFLAGAAYALALLHGIAGGVAAINEKLADLLKHQHVEGYVEDDEDEDADPD